MTQILTGGIASIDFLTQRITPEEFECPVSIKAFGIVDGELEGKASYSVISGGFFDADTVRQLFRHDYRNPINRADDSEELYLPAPKMDRVSRRFFNAKEEATRILDDEGLAETLLTHHWDDRIIQSAEFPVRGGIFQDYVRMLHRKYLGDVRKAERQGVAPDEARNVVRAEYRELSQLPFKAEVIPIAVLGRLAQVINAASFADPSVAAVKDVAAARFARERVVHDFAPNVLGNRFAAHQIPRLELNDRGRIDVHRSGHLPRIGFFATVSKIAETILVPFTWLSGLFCTFSLQDANIRAQRAFNEIWA